MPRARLGANATNPHRIRYRSSRPRMRSRRHNLIFGRSDERRCGPDGAGPQGGVIVDAAGRLYGVASGGWHRLWGSLPTRLRALGRFSGPPLWHGLAWLQDPELRRRGHVGLNKGEQQNALRRAVFFNRLREIRDRSYENQRHRASGLNLPTGRCRSPTQPRAPSGIR